MAAGPSRPRTGSSCRSSKAFAHKTGRAFRPEMLLGFVMNAYFAAAVAGLAAGGAYALLGVCAVFTYRLVAVVNFVGAAAGVAVGAIMTHWFAESPASTKAAVAVALLVGLAAVGLRITGGQHPHDFPSLMRGSAFRLAGVEVTAASVATLALALVFTLAANLFLNRSHTGLQLRALSERPV